MRSSVERTRRRLALALACLAITLVPRIAAAAIDRSLAQARRAIEPWLEARLGFAVSLGESRLVRGGRDRYLVALVVPEQAQRVGCSELVREPDTLCVPPDREPDVSTLIVARVGADPMQVPPLVVVLPTLEDDPGESVGFEDAGVVELNGDPAREVVVSMRIESGEMTGSTQLYAIDDDGRVVLERSLSECESGMGDEMDEGSCDDAFAYVGDTDGDGLAEISVVEGVRSDEALARWLDSLGGAEGAYDSGDEALDAISTDTYAWSSETRRMERR